MPKYPDYQEITAQNFPAIMDDMRLLVFKLLHQSKSPRKHWPDMIQTFWEYIWIHKDRFDRSKGAFTTWLSWEWRGFASSEARQANSPRKLDLEYKGLNPYAAQARKEDRTWSYEHIPDRNFMGRLIDPELEPDPEEEQVQKAEVLKALGALSPYHRFLVEQRLAGLTQEQIGQSLGITRAAVGSALASAVRSLQGNIKHRPPADRSFRPDSYWQEYLSSSMKTCPHWANTWEAAKLARLRNKWGK